MTPNNISWVLRIGDFPVYYWKLNKRERWTVDHTLEGMCRQNDPTKFYQSTICDECEPNTHLFGILNDGLGNKGLELQVKVDKQTRVLSPMLVRRIQHPDRRS